MVLRQQVWIDKSVQGALLNRVIIYWSAALVYAVLSAACMQYWQHPNWAISKHAAELAWMFWPWVPSAVLFLPLVVFDVVRVSNFFAGPIYRLRKHLAELNEDPECRPLTFREDDYWQDLVEPIHCLQAEILSLRAEVEQLKGRENTTGLTNEQLAVLAELHPDLMYKQTAAAS